MTQRQAANREIRYRSYRTRRPKRSPARGLGFVTEVEEVNDESVRLLPHGSAVGGCMEVPSMTNYVETKYILGAKHEVFDSGHRG